MFTDLLTPLIGAEWAALLATIIWIAIVIIALVIAWKLYLAFSGGINLLGGHARDLRLAIIDAAPIDQKRRIVLVRRDGVEHLIMIGGPNDLVIEQGIASPSITGQQPASANPKPIAKPAAQPTAQPATQIAQKAAPIAAAAPAIQPDPLEDIDLEEEDMFDSLIADRVAAAKKQQMPADTATAPAPKPAASAPSEPKLAPPPTLAPPAPSAPAAAPSPVAPPVASRPVAERPAQPAPQAQTAAKNDVSLEDEMQALIRDLQTK